MNVLTKLDSNSFNKTTNVNFMVAVEEKSLGFNIWVSWISVQNVMAIHLIVEIFRSGPMWWTD